MPVGKCGNCDFFGQLRRSKKLGKDMCIKCYRAEFYKKEPREKCFKCKKNRRVQTRIKGKPYCSSCHVKIRKDDPLCHEECAECHAEVVPYFRLGNGTCLCANCYNKMRKDDPLCHEVCAKCHAMGVPYCRLDDGKCLCPSCYHAEWLLGSDSTFLAKSEAN